MAKVFPDNQTTRVIFISQAEEEFYQACKEKLSDSWQVFYSCTLSTLEPGQGLRDNEIDFVLYHPRLGVICCEIKGGRIEYDAGSDTFYSINRHEKKFVIKNPFQQVLNWKSRFLRYLRKENIKVPVSHCVVFPKVDEKEIPQTTEVDPVLVLGRNKMQNFQRALEDLVLASQPEKFLEFEDVGKELDRIIRGTSFETRMYIRDYLDAHEVRVRDVQYIHETLITPISSARRLAIEGEAGTGKTMLAIMLAKHFKALDRRILLLSSNPFLNSYLRAELGEGIDIYTYPELSSTYGVEILRRPASFEGTREDWVQFEGPDRLKKAISNSQKRWDVVLCDEAQDVQPFWWDALETVLDRNNEDSRFYVFFDRSQGVFGSGGSEHFVPEDVLPVKPPYFPLVHNYRNTREIAGFARAFRTGTQILQSHSGRLGYLPEIITYDTPEDARAKLERLFNRLFDEERLEAKDVTILSARRPFGEGSVLQKQESIGGRKLVDLHFKDSMKGSFDPKTMIQASTIASFKGLETNVGVIMNLSEYNLPLTNPIMSSLLYVACSRAKHMLYLLVRKDDTKLDTLKKALAKLEYTGSMLIEGSSADFEFNGVVIHYNPERVGWLKVDDPAFEKNNVMFFPSDVSKANLGEIKLGAKLRFKPRVEGLVTIAADLVFV